MASASLFVIVRLGSLAGDANGTRTSVDRTPVSMAALVPIN